MSRRKKLKASRKESAWCDAIRSTEPYDPTFLCCLLKGHDGDHWAYDSEMSCSWDDKGNIQRYPRNPSGQIVGNTATDRTFIDRGFTYEGPALTEEDSMAARTKKLVDLVSILTPGTILTIKVSPEGDRYIIHEGPVLIGGEEYEQSATWTRKSRETRKEDSL